MTAERSEERERPSVAVGMIAAAMGGFFVFVLLATTGLFFVYRMLARDAAFVPPSEFPAPRLQTGWDGARDPGIADQQAALERFRWIDKSRGVFAVPIAPAMRMTVERGEKAYEPVLAPPPLPNDAPK